jgi:hypothetical protein
LSTAEIELALIMHKGVAETAGTFMSTEIADHAPVYPYEAVIRIKFTVLIRLTAVNITAVNLQV